MTYALIHKWARINLPLPKQCHCKSLNHIDASNKSGKYLKQISDWHWECRKCHMKNDGRSEKLKENGRSRKLSNKTCPECRIIFHTEYKKQINCSRKCGHKSMWKKRKEIKQ